MVEKLGNFHIYCTTIWKFTNPKRKNMEISRLFAENLEKYKSLEEKFGISRFTAEKFGISNPLHKNLETFKS